jgi:hypothetical protein
MKMLLYKDPKKNELGLTHLIFCVQLNLVISKSVYLKFRLCQNCFRLCAFWLNLLLFSQNLMCRNFRFLKVICQSWLLSISCVKLIYMYNVKRQQTLICNFLHPFFHFTCSKSSFPPSIKLTAMIYTDVTLILIYSSQTFMWKSQEDLCFISK